MIKRLDYAGGILFSTNLTLMAFSAFTPEILMNPLTEFFGFHMMRTVPQDFDLGL
ncbi:hypothetical protein [Xenorhabdus sp. SGI246]|uniref:hypothetical protein n=1 Tax=Xenorhabdus sp. SGI246 TaxID=3158263 RepID=UPI00349F2A4E